MAYLQCCPSDVEQSRKNNIESVVGWRIVTFEPAKERYEAAKHKYQTTDIPWFPLANSSIRFIWEQAYDGRCNAIADLSCKESAGSSIGHNYLLEKVEKIVKPAGSH